MNNFIKNDQLKLDILQYLSANPSQKHSPSSLASDLNYKYETVAKALDFLERVTLVKRAKERHGEKTYEYFSLTETGKKVAQSIPGENNG